MANEVQVNPVLTSAFSTNPLTAAIIERYMYEKVLSIAVRNTVFWKLGRMVKVPPGESKTITFQRFERLTATRGPLSEGITPAGKKMTVNKVLAVAEQWGDFVTLTDVVELTVRHEPVQRALELIGLDAAETVDREVQRVLQAGTNVFFPNDKSDRTALTTGDFPNTRLLSKVTASLRRGGAPAYEGARFVGVCDPENDMDLQADGTFVAAATYSNLTALQEAETGIWRKVRWMVSNNIQVLVLNTNVNPTVDLTAASTNGDTALADATYTLRVAANSDLYGFETDFSAAGSPVATTSQILHFTLPAVNFTGSDASATVTADSYNIYVKKDSGSFTLQASDQPSGTYALNGGGTNGTYTNSIAYSSTGRVASAIPPSGVNVHTMYVFGNEYYSVCELKGIQVLRTPPGAQKGDELDQRRSIGWKAFFKAVITNEKFGARIECESDFD